MWAEGRTSERRLNSRLAALLLAAALPLAGLPAFADTPATASAAPAIYTPTDVYGYLTMALSAGEFTRQAAQLALRRSHSEPVKAYAQAMLHAESESRQALLDESHRSGLHPDAPVLTGDLERRLEALMTAPDAGFDAAYLSAQADVQRQSLAAHRTYAVSGDNAILRAVAATLAPQVTQGLAQTEALQGPAAPG